MAARASEPLRDGEPSPEYLIVGQIVAPFGIRGEVKVSLDTDFPELVLQAESLYIGTPPVCCQVEWARPHKRMVRLKLVGCDGRDAAEARRGQLVQILRDDAPTLGEDEYYYHELIDLDVWTDEGEWLGRVAEVWPTGSNEVLVVRGSEGEILLPAIEPVILKVDLEAQRILIHLLEGLR